jgi:hypothetical protein
MEPAVEATPLLHRTKKAMRGLCPKSLLLWREARYFEKYGERELHLMRQRAIATPSTPAPTWAATSIS